MMNLPEAIEIGELDAVEPGSANSRHCGMGAC
jgi:hypothetical protein